MKLSQCPLRVHAKVSSVNVDPAYLLRLHELGVRPGAQFVAINRAAFGGMVINIGGTRVAVDHKSAACIMVESAVGAR